MTEFGLALRRIRLENQELLKDMATRLGVSSAFLSAVENGKKRIPLRFVQNICETYNLEGSKKADLMNAAESSAQEIRINLMNTTAAQHKVAVSFAKALDGLGDEEISEIMRIFEKRTKRR